MKFEAIANDVKAVRDTYRNLGIVGSVFTFFQGRATFFAIMFSGVGVYGFLKGYDLSSYAIFCGAIFTGVVGHSLKEDYFDLRHRILNQAEQRPGKPDGKSTGENALTIPDKEIR